MILILSHPTIKGAQPRPKCFFLWDPQIPHTPNFFSTVAPRWQAQQDLLHLDPWVTRQISPALLRTRWGTKPAAAEVYASSIALSVFFETRRCGLLESQLLQSGP